MAARRPETPTISVFKRNFVDRRDRREYATMRALPFPFLSSCFKWRLLTADVLTTLRDIRPLSSLLHLRSFALTMHPLFSRRKFIIVFFEFFSNSSNFAKGERESPFYFINFSLRSVVARGVVKAKKNERAACGRV